MKTDEKMCGEADDGGCKKKEHIVILEMQYEQTTHLEDTHDLGMFTKVTHYYCADCPTGQSLCHHIAERMRFQHNHWNDKRLGIDQPMLIDAYGWATDIPTTDHEDGEDN
ncbi:hypothetical protein ACHAW6_009740 [Cyclotella cf. meneghiniana]